MLFPRHFSDHSFHCMFIDCLPPFSLRQVSLGSILARPTDLSNYNLYTPLVARSHEIWPFMLSKPMAVGVCFPPVLPCMLICLWPFSVTLALSLSQQPWQSVFLPNCISILPAFFSVASSLPLVVEFVLLIFRSVSGLFRMIWQLSTYIHGRRQTWGPSILPLSSNCKEQFQWFIPK